jgi:hypothetical protein
MKGRGSKKEGAKPTLKFPPPLLTGERDKGGEVTGFRIKYGMVIVI